MAFTDETLTVLSTQVQDFFQNAGASKRALNALAGEERSRGIKFMAQLLTYSPRALARTPNLGKAVHAEIVNILDAHGLSLGSLEDLGEKLTAKDINWAAMGAAEFRRRLTRVHDTAPRGTFLRAMIANSQSYTVTDWLRDQMPLAQRVQLKEDFLASVLADPAVERRVGDLLLSIVREKLSVDKGPL